MPLLLSSRIPLRLTSSSWLEADVPRPLCSAAAPPRWPEGAHHSFPPVTSPALFRNNSLDRACYPTAWCQSSRAPPPPAAPGPPTAASLHQLWMTSAGLTRAGMSRLAAQPMQRPCD